MKKLIIIAIFFLPLMVIPQSQTPCECGEHETGITYYGVGEGQECCSGEAQGDASITFYEQSEGKTWKAVKTYGLNPADAQANCCEESV
jgi:hypothetical protein